MNNFWGLHKHGKTFLNEHTSSDGPQSTNVATSDMNNSHKVGFPDQYKIRNPIMTKFGNEVEAIEREEARFSPAAEDRTRRVATTLKLKRLSDLTETTEMLNLHKKQDRKRFKESMKNQAKMPRSYQSQNELFSGEDTAR